MKQLLALLVSAAAMFPLSACGGKSGAESQLSGSQYVELNSGVNTPTPTKKEIKVISSQGDYAAELANYSSAAPTLVDFSKGNVLLVDMGERLSGGHSVGVTSVDVAEDSVVANIRLVKPGKACNVTLGVTNPYQFVFIPSLKEILVSESLEVTNC